ncbi:MAG: hypothetical protein ACKV2T_41140 [Kofleriaceae bacterium]
MSELVSAPTPPRPRPGAAPTAPDSTPVPVLAEGTAPVAIPYRPAPRRAWPFVVAGITVIAIAAGAYAVVAKRDARREVDARYPIAASADESTQLANGATRWNRGKARLLSTLAAFDAPDLATLQGVGACTIATGRDADERAVIATDTEAPSWDDRDLAISLRHMILPGETLGDLTAVARPEIDQLIASAQRSRFATIAGRDHVLHALGGGFVIVRVNELQMPELDRAHDSIAPGVIAGTAYAFDPATGALRCAGTFRATSSSIGPLSSFSGLDRANTAAIRDFEAQTEAAIVSSLRSVD